MGTFRSGISTRGLSDSPAPEHSYVRRQNAGEYLIDVNLSTGGRLELITNATTLHAFMSHVREIGKWVDKDAAEWNRDLIELEQVARQGIDLRPLTHTLHAIRGGGGAG